MQNIKMVHGTHGKRYFATSTKQIEQRKLQSRKEELLDEWLTIPEGPVTISDILMSVGFYLLMPIMLFFTLYIVFF